MDDLLAGMTIVPDPVKVIIDSVEDADSVGGMYEKATLDGIPPEEEADEPAEDLADEAADDLAEVAVDDLAGTAVDVLTLSYDVIVVVV